LKLFSQFNDHKYVPFTFDFIRVKSYEGCHSTGTLHVQGPEMESYYGKHILLVEDIIDTGNTMSKLIPYLKQVGAASVKVASLMEKDTHKSCGFKADFAGFVVPDRFVVGYCMDYNDVFRDLNHLCIISEKGVEEFKNN
jgi:hypoxanthine phosphoribosyltransferase